MKEKKALVFGATGTLGQAIARHLSGKYSVTGFARSHSVLEAKGVDDGVVSDYSEKSLSAIAAVFLEQEQCFDLIINAVGVLHNESLKPEKRLQDLSSDSLQQYFLCNSIIPALLIKHFHGFLPKHSPGVFASLSAKVGSIEDNYLGGWYGYRASKAALNMLIKTAAIEIARTHKQAALVAIHPGTTIGRLSRPYISNTPEDKLYSPDLSAQRIIQVIHQLSPNDTGFFFDWTGEKLPW